VADPLLRSSTKQDLLTPTTITVVQPTGTLSTDIVILQILVSSASAVATWTAPAGWTAMGSSPFAVTATNCNFRLHLWWAPGTVNFSNTFSHTGGSGGQFTGVVCEAYSNVDSTTPIDVIAAAPSTSNGSATLSVASVTTVTDGALPVIAIADNNDGAFTLTNYTVDENAHANEAAAFIRANAVKTPAGAVGAQSVSDSGGTSGQSISGIMFALRPASTAVEIYPAGFLNQFLTNVNLRL
jgi:hypothetical protein